MTTPAWTTPHTWSTNDVLTSTQMNAVSDNLKYLGVPARVQAYRSSNLSISNTTETDVTLPSENWDTDGFHDTGSNTERITIPTGYDGLYLVTCQVIWAQDSTATRHLNLYKNASLAQKLQTSSGLVTHPLVMSGSHMLELSASDYITLSVYQDTGSALNVTSATFTAILMGDI